MERLARDWRVWLVDRQEGWRLALVLTGGAGCGGALAMVEVGLIFHRSQWKGCFGLGPPDFRGWLPVAGLE